MHDNTLIKYIFLMKVVMRVLCRTTFVKHYLTFWVKTLSATANVVPGNSSSTSSMVLHHDHYLHNQQSKIVFCATQQNGPTLPMSLILTLLLAIIMKNY